MGRYIVTVAFTIDAEDADDAAKQAHALAENHTPTQFWVRDSSGMGKYISLTDFDCHEALRRYGVNWDEKNPRDDN